MTYNSLGKHAPDLEVLQYRAEISKELSRFLGVTTFLSVDADGRHQQVEVTDAEARVIPMSLRGLTVSEAAAELFFSESTLKLHQATLRTKIKARDRSHMPRRLIETGLAPLPQAWKSGSAFARELTAKQLEALDLASRGLSRVAIASRMSIGESSVKSHLAALADHVKLSGGPKPAALHAVGQGALAYYGFCHRLLMPDVEPMITGKDELRSLVQSLATTNTILGRHTAGPRLAC